MRAIVVTVLAAILFVSVPLTAQKPVFVNRIDARQLTVKGGWFKMMDSLWFAGRVDAIGAELCFVLVCSKKLSLIAGQGDVEDGALVSFVSQAPTADKAAVISVLLRTDSTVAVLPARLNGRRKLIHITLSHDPGMRWASVWTSEKTEAAGLDDWTKLATGWTGAIGAAAEAALRERDGDTKVAVVIIPDSATRKPKPEPELVATVHEVILPQRNAKLAFAIRATTNSVDSRLLAVQLNRAVDDQTPTALRASLCATKLRAAGLNAAIRALDSLPIIMSTGDQEAVRARVDRAQRTVLTDADCDKTDATQAALVERAVREVGLLLATTVRNVDGTGGITNAPAQYVDVGSTVGYLFGAPDKVNHEVVNNAITAKPFTGAITSAVVQFHLPVDPSLDTPPWWTRLSTHAGVVLTPREGLTAGAAVRLWRGLGIHASKVWLRANALLPDTALKVGAAPPVGRHPFKSTLLGRWTAGFSVKIK